MMHKHYIHRQFQGTLKSGIPNIQHSRPVIRLQTISLYKHQVKTLPFIKDRRALLNVPVPLAGVVKTM